MRNWKLRWIVSGLILVGLIVVAAVKVQRDKTEAGDFSNGILVTSKEELDKEMKQDGILYIKGKIEGKANTDDITINDYQLSKDSSLRLPGQEPFIKKSLLWAKVSRGVMEFDTERYEENRSYHHNYFEKDSLEVFPTTLRVLDTEFEVEEEEDLVSMLGEEPSSVMSGSFHYSEKYKIYVPDEKMIPNKDGDYSVYYVKGIYSGYDGYLKISLKNGKPEKGKTLIFSPGEFERIDGIRKGGENYGVIIGAILLSWLIFTLLAWYLMKVFFDW